ncbi:MAG: hypothetical protein ACON4R_04980 [Akkermansiaceae bacterium]
MKLVLWVLFSLFASLLHPGVESVARKGSMQQAANSSGVRQSGEL